MDTDRDTDSEFEAEKARRDQAFARMFKPDELIWLLGERYDAEETTWRVDFLRQGFQGRWMYYRYHYDVPTSVIYFMGARPVEDEELRTLRRSGKVFPTRKAEDEPDIETNTRSEAQPAAQEQRRPDTRLLIFGSIAAALLLIIAILSINSGGSTSYVTGGASVLVLALPAFLAGLFSFLSPCTLPILPAYFAFTFQANKKSIVLMTIAFFLGLATTMTLLGATATAVSGLLFQNLDTLTFWGGLVVIVFGIMSLFGKGFAGLQVQERPAASVAGSYLYGATFALGWTACVGPILGALLTLLASQGVGIIQGGVLSFVYALGLGMPLILLATFFSRLGTGSRFWKIMRGRGFEVPIGSQTLHLHTTSIASGVLLILMGWMLASGQLTAITAWAEASPLAQWVLNIETTISRIFGLY